VTKLVSIALWAPNIFFLGIEPLEDLALASMPVLLAVGLLGWLFSVASSSAVSLRQNQFAHFTEFSNNGVWI
jgi:hypothetical protein